MFTTDNCNVNILYADIYVVLFIYAITVLVVMVFNVVVLVGSRVEPADTMQEGIGQNWASSCKRVEMCSYNRVRGHAVVHLYVG